MKLSKEQRHQIYQYAYDTFIHSDMINVCHSVGMCYRIQMGMNEIQNNIRYHDLNQFETPNVYEDLLHETEFPELYCMHPDKISSFWGQNSELRQMILLFCIEMSRD